MEIIERWLFTLYKARALAKGNFSHFLETVLIQVLVDNRIRKMILPQYGTYISLQYL